MGRGTSGPAVPAEGQSWGRGSEGTGLREPGAISRPREHQRSPGRATEPRPRGSRAGEAAEPSPRHTEQRWPSPAPDAPGEVSQPGVQAEHTQHTFLAGGIPARQRDPPFTESGDFSQGGPALALLELAAAMASPPAGSRERRRLSTAPTAPREPKHSPMLLRVPGTAGTRGKGWAIPGKHRLPLLINQPCTTGNAVSLGEEPLHGTATSQAGQCHLQTPPLGTGQC